MDQADKSDETTEVLAAQKAILAAMRAGQCFRTAHHEGGTHLSFDGHSFVRNDYGEEPARERYRTDEAMLVCLRNFFDWDARRDVWPGQVPELQVWHHIQRQLRD